MKIEIDVEEFLIMLEDYWSYDNNDDCYNKTIEYLENIGIPEDLLKYHGIKED